MSDADLDAETDAAFDEFLRTDPHVQSVLKSQWAERMENALSNEVETELLRKDLERIVGRMILTCEQGKGVDDLVNYVLTRANHSAEVEKVWEKVLDEIERHRNKWKARYGDLVQGSPRAEKINGAIQSLTDVKATLGVIRRQTAGLLPCGCYNADMWACAKARRGQEALACQCACHNALEAARKGEVRCQSLESDR